MADVWTKVRIRGAEECWPFTGSLSTHGYGQFHINRSPVGAHRLVYEATFGPIPLGMFVCHHCDKRDCCNPSHLFLGTAKQNSADMVRKRRSPHGERCGRSKLSADNVREIRRLAKEGMPQKAIACLFGVTKENISSIVLRKTWKFV